MNRLAFYRLVSRESGCPGAPHSPISCQAVLEKDACAPFIKERRMECVNATSLRRKSGRGGPYASGGWGVARSLSMTGMPSSTG